MFYPNVMLFRDCTLKLKLPLLGALLLKLKLFVVLFFSGFSVIKGIVNPFLFVMIFTGLNLGFKIGVNATLLATREMLFWLGVIVAPPALLRPTAFS